MSKMKDIIVDICEQYQKGKSIKEIQDSYPEYKSFLTERYIVNTLIAWYIPIFEEEPKD